MFFVTVIRVVVEGIVAIVVIIIVGIGIGIGIGIGNETVVLHFRNAFQAHALVQCPALFFRGFAVKYEHGLNVVHLEKGYHGIHVFKQRIFRNKTVHEDVRVYYNQSVGQFI